MHVSFLVSFPHTGSRRSLTRRLSEYFIVHFTLPPDRGWQRPEQFSSLRNMSYLLIASIYTLNFTVISSHSLIVCLPAATYPRTKKVCEDSLIRGLEL